MGNRPLRKAPTQRWVGLSMMLLMIGACSSQQGEQQGAQGNAPSVTDNLILASSMVALPPPGTSPEGLPDPESAGATLLRKYCTACHSLPSPQTHSVTDWPVVLRRMWLRAEGVSDQFDVPVPTSAERVTLLNYLLDHALQVSSSDLPAGPGRDLFTSTCNRCHDLPDPKQHSSNDWAAVVIRMRQHMVQMLHLSPPQDQVQEIILYLERASARGD